MVEVVTYLERLREIALDHHGFVTAAQAVAEGIPKTELPRLAARQRVERVTQGVYRIPQVPATPYDNWALAVLWTGAPEACLSHETALSAWDVSDVNPDRIHLTVNRNRRLRRAGGNATSSITKTWARRSEPGGKASRSPTYPQPSPTASTPAPPPT